MSIKQLTPATAQTSVKRKEYPDGNQSDDSDRLVIVSNRLPFTLSKVVAKVGAKVEAKVGAKVEGQFKIKSSSGGLVTAMEPVLRHHGGLWVGWPGVAGEPSEWHLLQRHTQKLGYQVAPIFLSEEEIRLFYQGFSNEVLWPLFHCSNSRCLFDPIYWQSYQSVNKKFADVIGESIQSSDLIWVHDYHLILLGKHLKELGVTNNRCFFLHIPFPPERIFMMMPWAKQILRAMLSYNLLGFQTPWHKTYFLHSVKSLLRKIHIVRKGLLHYIEHDHGTTKVGSFPIGIDDKHFTTEVKSPQAQVYAEALLADLGNNKIILGVDRMDYTKGIRHKLRGFGNMLGKYHNMIGKVTLVQVLVPSREQIPEYEEIKQEVEQMVGEINGKFSRPDWTPIVYQYRTLKHEELLGYYYAANIALITPLDDGMNLVAKEFCACAKASSVLVISKFAGAVAQLGKNALIVNPFDIEGMADIIYHACTMPLAERTQRMMQLKKIVKTHNVLRWVEVFLRSARAGYPDPQQRGCSPFESGEKDSLR